MSREAKANINSVKSAIEQLQQAGEKITVRRIHQITGGDYNTVANLQKQLNQQSAERLTAPREVSALFETLADDLYTKTRHLAERIFEQEKAAIVKKMEGVEAERDEAGQAVTELSKRLEAAQNATDDQMSQLREVLSETQRKRDEARGQVKSTNAAIAELQIQREQDLTQQKLSLEDTHQKQVRTTAAAHEAKIELIEEKNQMLVNSIQMHADEQRSRNERLEFELRSAVEKQGELAHDLLEQSKAASAAQMEIQSLKAELSELKQERDPGAGNLPKKAAA